MKDVTPHHIGNDLGAKLLEEAMKVDTPQAKIVELRHDTPTVDRILRSFTDQWTKTADDCIRRAQELEDAAADLRKRANILQSALDYANDVKATVDYEIDSRNRVNSLALVNPRRSEE